MPATGLLVLLCGDPLDLERDPNVIVRNDLIVLRKDEDDLCLVTIGLNRRDVGAMIV